MSHKSQRLTWRSRCRRWQRYINALLAGWLLAVLLAAPGSASVATAAPACPGGALPDSRLTPAVGVQP